MEKRQRLRNSKNTLALLLLLPCCGGCVHTRPLTFACVLDGDAVLSEDGRSALFPASGLRIELKDAEAAYYWTDAKPKARPVTMNVSNTGSIPILLDNESFAFRAANMGSSDKGVCGGWTLWEGEPYQYGELHVASSRLNSGDVAAVVFPSRPWSYPAERFLQVQFTDGSRQWSAILFLSGTKRP